MIHSKPTTNENILANFKGLAGCLVGIIEALYRGRIYIGKGQA
jgi:hypothetical protein